MMKGRSLFGYPNQTENQNELLLQKSLLAFHFPRVREVLKSNIPSGGLSSVYHSLKFSHSFASSSNSGRIKMSFSVCITEICTLGYHHEDVKLWTHIMPFDETQW